MKIFTPSVGFVNDIINAPGVRPTVQQGLYRLEARSFLEEPNNAAVAYWGGVMLFDHIDRGLYEGHVFCLPGQRGKLALEFGRLGVSWLFDKVGADRLIAPVPLQLSAARFYCRKLGLRAAYRDLFQEYFTMEAQQWAA